MKERREHSELRQRKRCEQQAEIALELFIDGESDAYNGVRPVSSDLAYMAGYSQGTRRKLVEVQNQAQMLEAEGLAVEAMFGEEIPF
jgi:hypothetical protein